MNIYKKKCKTQSNAKFKIQLTLNTRIKIQKKKHYNSMEEV